MLDEIAQKILECVRESQEEFASARTSTVKTEAWMANFVKGRHSHEEWDGFFTYCEAGPTKRRLIKMASFLCQALFGLPRQSAER